MTDWATRVSTTDHPMKEMQSSTPGVDEDATIQAIRKIIHDQEHLLPRDLVESVQRRQLGALPVGEPAAAVKKPGVLAALRSLRR